MPITDILIYTALLLGGLLSYRFKKLTLAGALTGAIVGALIYKGAGYTGIALLATSFIAGTVATTWQAKQKATLPGNESESSQRTAGQVLANGGTAAILGALAILLPAYQQIFQLMIAGSLASATADTLSSELGTVYGKRFFNIITFKRDERGLDGVISLEGTMIGIAGAALIGLVYSAGFGWSVNLLWIIAAGFVGNVTDSALGATMERNGLIGNNVVNFLNTATGAVVAGILTLT
ncbi:DUF92 domain-containing protein [Mucilaginibacter myungsuensis]|uniref:DUF92 domain-containing protein n=1 Tax=Mucilaginibacter myungsuensis TaxID=649104 RepID=A0A929KUD6_9SPHI|nr:DUF92 domain-containing protein [Mucilaginibacter myungsuensis]MBE9660610.1 DUF92 domain-containing protein [Mucilaginibacter myungsuensis]MDN3600655.1 DUF92 domain-containing protein [Mucilaginibacter myungsuensis]